jgi:hypothetical protein
MTESGEWSDLIGKLRAETDEGRQQALKRKLPCVTVSGIFEGGHHSDNMIRHSGLICLDFDGKDNPTLAGCADMVRDKLANDPFVNLVFVSARGKGVAAIVRIEPDRHGAAFDGLADHFKKEHGLIADKSCCDATRLRFVSWSDVKTNQHARTFDKYRNDPPAEAKPETPATSALQPLGNFRRNEILSALEVVSPDDRQTWLNVGMAIHSENQSLEGFNLWRIWSELNDAAGKFNEKDMGRVWKSFGKREGVHIETLFKLAYANEWKGPPKEIHVAVECRSVNASDLLGARPPAPEYIVDGVFEKKSRGLAVGSSKTKKSFASLQLGVCVSSGHDFCGFEVNRPHRVLLVNLENAPDWQHRRLLNMCQSLRIDGAALGDRLAILNGRGKSVDLTKIEVEAIRHGAELIILDPLYKLDGGADECDQTERKRLITELELIGERTGAALLYVHHDAKGQAGDRDIRDRGAGSSIINRDVDWTLALTAWGRKEDEDADNLVVLSILARNAPPRPDATLLFNDGAFVHVPDREHCKATSRTVQARGRVMQGDPKADAKALADWARSVHSVSMTALREKGDLDFGAARTKRCMSYLKEHPQQCGVTYAYHEKTHKGFVGTFNGVSKAIENKEGFLVL